MTGRPTELTDELAILICERIMQEPSVKAVCEADDMPERWRLYSWLAANPTFADSYTRAREVRLQTMADDIDDIGQGTLNGTYEHQAARIAIDAKKWILSKLKPRVYGDKLAVGGDADAPPIQTEAKVKLDLSGLSMEELDVLEKVMRSTGAKLPQEEDEDDDDGV
jgi:hypothetical protein